ncbi:multisubstrate pseudouridine synthase 7, partial [Coelomomyces lativittatus]
MLRAKRSHEDDNNMCSSPSIQALSGNEDFRKIIDVIPSNNCETACSSSAEKVTDRDSNKYCSGNETFTSLKQKRKRILININEESPNFENAMKIKRKPCSSPPFELVSLHKENRFGIEEYMLENYQGFSGIIKDSYSDFIVQEIDTDNQVVEMNDSSIPAYFSLESEEKEKTFLSLNSISDFIQELSNLLNCYEDSENEFLNQVSSYLTLNLGNSPPKETKTITSNNIYPCKEHRTKIHSFLKSYSLLNSDTFEQHIRIHVGKQKKLNQRSNSLNWPSAFRERGDYVLFHLYKENMDTLEAIRYLSHFLHVPESHFAFAGTKDKRAITIQRCTVFRIHPKRLISFKHPRMKCGHFQLIKEPLKLGALNGNQFRIRLRNVQMTYTSLQLDSFLGDLKEVGIINYFGMQRFGTGSISSHQI